jgi:excisionase family DNA binding protein
MAKSLATAPPCDSPAGGFLFHLVTPYHKTLDRSKRTVVPYNRMKTYSSREAAKKLGVSLMTLQRYIAARKITAPKLQTLGAVKARVWTARDIERVGKQMKKKS